MRTILLNPGPVNLSAGVRQAAVAVDLCHREPEFFDLQDRVRHKVTGVYHLPENDWTAVTFAGSGTTALEAMVTTLVPRDGRLLVLENGVYGERLRRLAEIHQISHEAIQVGWSDAWDLQRLAAALAAGDFTHVAAVHHETTTGRLNPIDHLAGLCQQHGVRLLLDTVSSFGAEAIPFDSPAVIACAVTANKCLHAIPGLCLVVVRRSELTAAVEPPRSLSLDLALWAQHQVRRSTPFTPPVNGLLALDQALTELADSGGWTVRHARYHRLADRVSQRLARLGVTALLPAHESSCVLRAYHLPGGQTYQTLHDGLKLHGFVIYAGQGKLLNEMFRISTMGDISDYDIEQLLVAFDEVFS